MTALKAAQRAANAIRVQTRLEEALRHAGIRCHIDVVTTRILIEIDTYDAEELIQLIKDRHQ